MKDDLIYGYERILAAVRSKGWELFDITGKNLAQASFEELTDPGPTIDLRKNHRYQFLPIPRDGQTYQEAYADTEGIGPAILVDDVYHEKWFTIDVVYVANLILFMQMEFLNFDARFFSPPFPGIPMDEAICEAEYILDLFEQNFIIVTSHDFVEAVQTGVNVYVPKE